jgi:hypothetical protein
MSYDNGGKIPTNGLVFYINGADRNCFVSGSFSGRQLVGSNETLNFQSQARFYPQFGGYWGLSSPSRGINGSGSLTFSSTITFPNQYTHIIVMRRNDVVYENQGWVAKTASSGRISRIVGAGSTIALTNANSSLFSNTTLSNNTDWFFGCGKNELVGSTWTQSLFVRGFNAGTRVYETKTQNLGNGDWVGGSGSWTSVSLGNSNLDNAGFGLYMSYNRPLSLAEIDTIYDSIKFRYNMPIQ